jgi:hypothetical protein
MMIRVEGIEGNREEGKERSATGPMCGESPEFGAVTSLLSNLFFLRAMHAALCVQRERMG